MPKKRKPRSKSSLPKGAYRLPNGSWVVDHGPEPETAGQKRRIRVVGVRREPLDLERLAKAIIAGAIEQAQREMKDEQDRNRPAA